MSTAAIPIPDELTGEDQALVWTVATLLLDVVPAFSEAVTRCIHDQLPSLPRDEEHDASLQAIARAGPRELLTTLRAGMPASAHETPVEMLAHARYLRSRGLGLHHLIDIYKIGVPMFRNIMLRVLEERASDRAQLERIGAAADAYLFAFISTALRRQAVAAFLQDRDQGHFWLVERCARLSTSGRPSRNGNGGGGASEVAGN